MAEPQEPKGEGCDPRESVRPTNSNDERPNR